MHAGDNDTVNGADGDHGDGAVSSMHYLGFADRDSMTETVLSSGSYFFFSKDNVHEILPVPEATQRMLLQPPEYWALNIDDPIDFNRLQWACTELVRRHEILRTVFVSFKNRYLHVVFDQIDTSGRTWMGLWTSIDAKTPCLFRRRPLVTRFTYIQGEQDKQILVVRLSHAQFDGYSLHTLWHDLKRLYEGQGTPSLHQRDYPRICSKWIKAQHQEEAFKYLEVVLEGSTVTRITNAIFDDNSHAIVGGKSHLITSSHRA
ncbi:hypothetical protein BDW69DRAFT_46964 [Aspergillus filifer]